MFATASIARTLVGTAGAALFAATCLVGAVAPAQAQDAVRTQTVRFDDLNLSNDAGRAALEQRIRAAAKSVCSVAGDDVASRNSVAKCTKVAVANATRS